MKTTIPKIMRKLDAEYRTAGMTRGMMTYGK